MEKREGNLGRPPWTRLIPGRTKPLESWAPTPLPLRAAHSARPGVLRPGLVPAGPEQAPTLGPGTGLQGLPLHRLLSPSQAAAPEGGWHLPIPTELGAARAGTAPTPRACPWRNRWPHSQSESLSPYTDDDLGTRVLLLCWHQSLAPKTAGSVS